MEGRKIILHTDNLLIFLCTCVANGIQLTTFKWQKCEKILFRPTQCKLLVITAFKLLCIVY
jgi:hypothetical protein